MELLNLLALTSVFVFSISAALSSIQKKYDMFGISFITFVAAVGGGTVRDLLLGCHPLFWMENPWFVVVIIAGLGFTFLLKRRILFLKQTFFLFDTLGISLSAILGTQKAIDFGVSPFIAIFFGLVTAVFGGILRDMMTNQIPLVFRKEIYASACLAGAFIYIALQYIGAPTWVLYGVPTVFIFAIRIISIKYKLSLPRVSL